MKRTFFTTTALTAAALLGLTAGSAMAGNLDEPVLTPAPVIVTPVAVTTGGDWTGFYAGGSLGYADVGEDTNAFDDDGVTYGLHGGYDYDFGTFVLGGELEISGFDVADGGADVDSVLRAKVRAGYDAGRWLPYVTAGIAQLDVSGVGDDTGAVYGFGVDYSYTDNIRVGGEVLQHEFDNFEGTGLDLDATTLSVRVAFEF